MKLSVLVLTSLLLLVATTIYGQETLVLQHRSKANKTRKLKLDREYTIKTADTTYSSPILGFTDSTLLILHRVKAQDTARVTAYYEKAEDTIEATPRWVKDSLTILISDVEYIKKEWFENREWLRLPAWFAIGAVLAVPFLPVVAIAEGAKGVKEWAIFEGTLIAIAGPPIFIGTRKTKYDLKEDWKVQSAK